MRYCQHDLELDKEGNIFCILCGADKEALLKDYAYSAR